MVSKPKFTLESLYEKLELSFDSHVNESLMRHLQSKYAEQDDFGQRRSPFLTTYMGPEHRANVWKYHLNPKTVRKIEAACTGFMEYFDYVNFTRFHDSQNIVFEVEP